MLIYNANPLFHQQQKQKPIRHILLLKRTDKVEHFFDRILPNTPEISGAFSMREASIKVLLFCIEDPVTITSKSLQTMTLGLQ